MDRNKVEEYIKNMSDEDVIMLAKQINGYSGDLEALDMYPFDEDFFQEAFTDPDEAARATFFGDIKNWSDDYIGFNAYGNLVSMSEGEYASLCRDYSSDIAIELEDITEDGALKYVDVPDDLYEILTEDSDNGEQEEGDQ